MTALPIHAYQSFEDVRVNSLPLIDILCHAWFKEGFLDSTRGRAPVTDFHGDSDSEWFYQHGRQVASEARATYGRVPHLWCETDAGNVINPLIISLAGAMFMTGAFA